MTQFSIYDNKYKVIGDFSPPGKCDRMNNMQKTLEFVYFLKATLYLCGSSLICIGQKYKIADKIASDCSVNLALTLPAGTVKVWSTFN
jgi:hypothetical protein